MSCQVEFIIVKINIIYNFQLKLINGGEVLIKRSHTSREESGLRPQEEAGGNSITVGKRKTYNLDNLDNQVSLSKL